MSVHVITMLNAVLVTGASGSFERRANRTTFQAKGNTTAGSGSATIKIQVSNDGSNWIDAATITLALVTGGVTDGFTLDAPWKYCRANLTAISGTGGNVTVYKGS